MTCNPSKKKALESLRLKLIDSYERLIETSSRLQRVICESDGACEVAKDSRYGLSAQSGRHYAASAIAAWHYVDPDQTPDDTICAPGAISVTEDAIQIAHDLNKIKTEELPLIRKAIKRNLSTGDTPITELTAEWLRKAGMADMHRRQAHRRVLIFDTQIPIRIAFSWCRARRLVRMTKDQALHYLEKACDGEWAQVHRPTIEQSRSPAFARFKGSPNFHLRANIQVNGVYKLYTTSLPVLVQDDLEFPIVQIPRHAPWEEGFVETFKKRDWQYMAEIPVVDRPRIYGYKKLPRKSKKQAA